MDYLNPDLLTNINPILICQMMEDADLRLEVELTQQCDRFKAITHGTIPSWLQGTFIRNCPILVTDKDGNVLGHSFDGPAMLFGFTLRDQSVIFTNRYIRSIAYEKIVHEETVNFYGFESYPRHTFLQKAYNLLFVHTNGGPTIQNANVNLWKLASEVVALTETPLPVRVDPTTLKTLGVFEYEDSLPKSDIWESAHPHLDPATGDTISFLIEFGYRTYYVVYRIVAGTKTRQEICRLEVERASYMHAFSITENYIIFVENPLVASAWDFVVRDSGFIQHYEWNPSLGNTFIIFNRKTGEVEHKLKYDGDVFFTLHHVNAYEAEGEIVVDLIAYTDNGVLEAARKKCISASDRTENVIPKMRRFHVSLADKHIAPAELTVEDVEFPRINDAFNGRPYRFVYAVDGRDEVGPSDELQYMPLVKVDLITHNRTNWYEQDCVCDEPVFVAAPTNEGEDDGIVFSVVSNIKTRKSFLLILDAKSFTEVSRTDLPMFVPRGLHGQFFEGVI
jgi:beta,beta-carotene 9',10'-dioxygenase